MEEFKLTLEEAEFITKQFNELWSSQIMLEKDVSKSEMELIEDRLNKLAEEVWSK